MAGFEDFKLTWNEREYVIPAHRVLGAIARVEEVLTLQDLQQYGQRGVAPLAKVAMAYGRLLRYAGANVNDQELYNGMFGAGTVTPTNVLEAVGVLVAMMIPPDVKTKLGSKKSGNVSAPAAGKKKSLSKKPTS